MDNLTPKYEWRFEIEKRDGSLTLPELPRDIRATLWDSYTMQFIPIVFDRTNIVKVVNKTCGSIQWLSVADMLVWSSFDPNRFVLLVERAARMSATTDARRSAELCK